MSPEISDTGRGNLSREFGIEFNDREAAAYPKIELPPNTTAEDYARRVIAEEAIWGSGHTMRVQTFLQVVGTNFQRLVSQREPEDLERAQTVFTDYADKLHQPHINADGQLEYHEADTWLQKVRAWAGFNRGHINPRHLPDIGYLPGDDGTMAYSSEQFWQDIYLKSAKSESARMAFGNYILGRQIEQKDPSILLGFIEKIQDEGVEKATEEIMGGTSRTKPEALARQAYDAFLRIIDEASVAGWKNAEAISEMFADLPKRDMPPHALIIAVGNNVADVLQKNGITAPNLKTGRVSTRNLENVTEAINRCTYMMFDLGQQPKDHESLNYLLTAQIINALFGAANKLLKQ